MRSSISMTRSTICLRPPDWTSAVKRRRKELSIVAEVAAALSGSVGGFLRERGADIHSTATTAAERPHSSPMRMAAVVFAASGSNRFGKPKQLTIFRGERFVRRIVAAGAEPTSSARCSPAQYMETRRAVISGNPDPKHISTSYDERDHTNLRMSNCRFTRLTNAFSK
jgi:hypothetical protein